MANFKKIKTNLKERDASVPYEAVAPGLYPGEVVVELKDKTKVAVSVERHWAENGGGIAFHGFARVIEDDGSTKLLQPGDKHIETSISWHAPPLLLKEHGADKLAADVARVVLGEPTKLTQKVPQEDGPDLDHPVVDLPAEILLNGSIEHQLIAIEESKKTTIGI